VYWSPELVSVITRKNAPYDPGSRQHWFPLPERGSQRSGAAPSWPQAARDFEEAQEIIGIGLRNPLAGDRKSPLQVYRSQADWQINGKGLCHLAW
jgi:hypothetical protein